MNNQIPEKDFDQLETAQEWAELVVNKWSQKREKIVKELLGMASSVSLFSGSQKNGPFLVRRTSI